jgi:hypothetical protein
VKEDRCVVCGERLDEVNSAVCDACGGRYHLIVRRDRPGKDCGDVWLNEAYLVLEYACSNCLGGGSAPAGSAEASGEGQPGRARRPQAGPERAPRRPARLVRPRGSRIRRRYRKR